MLSLAPRQKTALRMLAVLASIPLITKLLPDQYACAQDPSATPAATSGASLKLFADSRIVQRGRISVEVVGRGPDLVLIPGLASSRETWRRTAERLRERYRLHLVQVAGFAGEPAGGNAQGSQPSPVLVPTAEDIDGYIRSAGLAPATVIGHSMGGTMALWLAENRPADIKRVLLVDALPFYGVLMGGPGATAENLKPMAEAMRSRMSAPGDHGAAARPMIASMVTAPADVDRIVGWSSASDRLVAGQAVADDITLDMRPGLSAVRAPVTLIYPFDPKMGVPQAQWDALYASQYAPLPGAKLVKVEPSRHFVMYDQPAKFDIALDAFLSNRAGKP